MVYAMLQDDLYTLQKTIHQWLEEAGVAAPVVQFERAVKPEFGEYSCNAAMRYAKELGGQPFAIAQDLAAFLQTNENPVLADVQAVQPGFVNLYFSPAAKLQHLDTIRTLGSAFGTNTRHRGERWVIEHTSPNPNKAMHIGHLRINLIGMGIVRLLRATGAEVIADGVYNDRGIAIAKVMYGYLAHRKKATTTPTDLGYWVDHQDEWQTPAELEMKPDVFISETYVLGEKDFKHDPEAERVTRHMVVDWEAGDVPTRQLWERLLQYVYAGNERVLQRLGSHWDRVWYEHEHYLKGKEYVAAGLEKGIFERLADGAVITKLEAEYGLPDTVLLKRDGTSLYLTQDIALTDLKKQTYQADKLIWVIGPEQSLHMKQLFAVCEQLGIGTIGDFTHVAYGNVGLRRTDGGAAKMSSREGNVVLADEVIDLVKATIKERFDQEDRHAPTDREALAETLAIAAVKFAFLKPDKMQDIAFDVAQSVDIHGDSGMYIEYTYVRTRSILQKAGRAAAGSIDPVPTIGTEAELLRTLLYYEDVIDRAVTDLSVHHIAQYLLELCSAFNSWYAAETILDGSEREQYKLALVEATGIVINNGAALLGIKVVDEM